MTLSYRPVIGEYAVTGRPFIPYVYRGTGVDQIPVRAYPPGESPSKCRKCGYQYKTKHHRETCRKVDNGNQA